MSETSLIVKVALVAADIILFCCCVIGNSVVIYVIRRERKLKRKSNYHILSVCVADLLIGLIGIPLSVNSVSWKLTFEIKEINRVFVFRKSLESLTITSFALISTYLWCLFTQLLCFQYFLSQSIDFGQFASLSLITWIQQKLQKLSSRFVGLSQLSMGFFRCLTGMMNSRDTNVTWEWFSVPLIFNTRACHFVYLFQPWLLFSIF